MIKKKPPTNILPHKWIYIGAIICFIVGCTNTTVSTHLEQKKIEIPEIFTKEFPQINDSIISQSDREWVKNSFNEFIRKRRFNGSVLVAKKNEIIIDTTLGYADIRKRIKLVDTSAIQLASITKPITATVIMQLLGENKLKLTDKLTQHIPELPKNPYGDITIQMLLSHQTGLSQYYYYCDHIIEDKSEFITNENLIDIIDENKPKSYFSPGKRFNYCNTNFVLLAMVAERIDNMPFNTVVKKRIFEPANMKYSFVLDVKNEEVPENLVFGNSKFNRIIEFDFLDGIVGDKGLFSNARDLFEFDRNLRSCNVLSDSLFQIATQPHTKIDRSGSAYGLGWRLRFNDKLGKIVYHTGWWHGNRHIYFKIPNSDYTVIILSNSMHGSTYNLNELLEIFYSVDQF
jgi:CubicO group peptidase (beta-lactamase class C family)